MVTLSTMCLTSDLGCWGVVSVMISGERAGGVVTGTFHHHHRTDWSSVVAISSSSCAQNDAATSRALEVRIRLTWNPTWRAAR
jgi:hypothetical protein